MKLVMDDGFVLEFNNEDISWVKLVCPHCDNHIKIKYQIAIVAEPKPETTNGPA